MSVDGKRASRSRSSSRGRRSRSPQRGQRKDSSRGRSSRSSSSRSSREGDDHIVTLHGLPYSATHSDILEFLHGCSVVDGKKGIQMVIGDDGRVSGDCFAELKSSGDVKLALSKHRNNMGRRYVEVFRATRSEMEHALRSRSASRTASSEDTGDTVVRLRGLPYECTKEEIASFFLGLAIAPNGIALLTDSLGRTQGEGYVKFAEPQLVEKALAKHKEKIRHRYIEVYKSSWLEMNSKTNRMETFDGIGGGFGGGMGGGFGGRPGSYDRSSRFGMMGYASSRFGGGPSRFGDFGGGGGTLSRGGGGRAWGVSKDEYISHTGHYIHMRGLPYSATEDDVAKFFEPIVPVNIYIDYNRAGSATGEANVDFDGASDANAAMRKNRNMMQHRYIELYLNCGGPGRF